MVIGQLGVPVVLEAGLVLNPELDQQVILAGRVQVWSLSSFKVIRRMS